MVNCKKDKDELIASINNIKRQLEEFHYEIFKVRENVNQHTADLNTKVEKHELNDFRQMVHNLPTTKDVLKWQDSVNNEMGRFLLEQKDFRKDFEVQKQIIRRYDEVMNTKASKVSLKTIQNEMESLVEAKLDDTR